jgi:ribosomal protein S8
VSRRDSELKFFNRRIKEVNDFKNSFNPEKTTLVDTSSRTKNKVKELLLKTGFLAYCNNNDEIDSVRPWVITLRGHYSGIRLNQLTVLSIFKEIEKIPSIENKVSKKSFAVHYRLGDLIHLVNKKPIEFTLLNRKINQIKLENNLENLYLFSDSLELARAHLAKTDGTMQIFQRDVSPLETIKESVHFDFFIGTNSKLSIWIAIFRACSFKNKKSFLPKEIQRILAKNICDEELTNLIEYY